MFPAHERYNFIWFIVITSIAISAGVHSVYPAALTCFIGFYAFDKFNLTRYYPKSTTLDAEYHLFAYFTWSTLAIILHVIICFI